MTLQSDLKRIVELSGIPGLSISFGTPVPPEQPFMRPGELSSALRNACIELNRSGTILGRFADLIVERAPDKVNVRTIKPYVEAVRNTCKEALAAVIRHRDEGHESERELYTSTVTALETAIDALERAETVQSELSCDTTDVRETFIGFGDDAEVLAQAFREGGVPAVFDAVIESGLDRDYKLALYGGSLVFVSKDGLNYPVQFADDELVVDRVTQLIEENELSEEATDSEEEASAAAAEAEAAAV